MSEYYSNISDDIKQNVINEYLDKQKNKDIENNVLEDYNNYIASFEYGKALQIESICEDIEAYTLAHGNYYELILFYLNDFIQSFNYKKYMYLRFYYNIKSDDYYSDNGINIKNLVSALNDSENQTIFNNNYMSKETRRNFSDLISKRINETFIIYNYYRNNIKQPYKYKSNIYNYLIKDYIYDYTNILHQHILLSPCEYDDIFLNNLTIYNSIKTDSHIIDCINNSIYSMDFETFIDLSFIIKYYSDNFSRDGIKTLHTFYTNKMDYLVIPELYKKFLSNIKNSKNIYNLYEKTKYVYSIDIDEELNCLNKELCPNATGLIFIFKCNYVYKLWRLIFNNNIYNNYYPEKKTINKINENIIATYNKN
jgi:hypothetical protein